jgi:hypothetical protein
MGKSAEPIALELGLVSLGLEGSANSEWSYGLDYFTRTELKSYLWFHENLSRIIQSLLKGASKLAFGEISKISPSLERVVHPV